MLIMKFGGTSVGSAERMKAVVKLLPDDRPVIAVLSAMSGTTNALIQICNLLKSREDGAAILAIEALESLYREENKSLLTNEPARESLSTIIHSRFTFLKSLKSSEFTEQTSKEVVALGELMSTAMFHALLTDSGHSAALMNALDFMRIDGNGEPDLEATEGFLRLLLDANQPCRLFVTQGFICRNEFGAIDNLQRGGSDYTASIIGGVLGADEIQIWTDIDGMHNNDPRIVEGTRPVHRLSFEEAAELAYFGAKILHPKTIHPARIANVPVMLKNTLEPEAPGTIITAESAGTGIKAIAAKDGITAIKIKSDRMLLAYGFLRRVFEVFEAYRTPIDMIATSEVAVSLTIDNDNHLDNIKNDLSKFGSIETEKDQTIICLVGDLVADSKGIAAKVFDALRHTPIRMVSYGGSKHNISLLVKTENKNEALRALHQSFFS
jgi:aspartate kinase